MFSKFATTPPSEEFLPADLYEAQAEWEAEQYELEQIEAMLLEDDPYDGEMWDDVYDDHPADMYEWDCDLHNEFWSHPLGGQPKNGGAFFVFEIRSQ